ncbi:unnamed protein product, partial [Symbiodinium sp. KB8]
MLVEKGSFDKVELVVKQWHEKKTREETTGGYVTKKWLIDNKTMADNAFKWAHPRGRCRKNVITGEEEADIPLDERWQVMKEKGQRMDFENGCELDDPDGCLLEATGFDGQDHLEGAGAGADAQPAASVAAAQAGASFKLCFPSLQQNTSPTAILPDFITVLGRKLDNGDEAKDKCRAMGVARAASIADQIETSLKTLQTVYDDLLKLQASAATATKDDDMIEEAILKKYVEATKEDLALNNYVQRGKQPGFNGSVKTRTAATPLPKNGARKGKNDDDADKKPANLKRGASKDMLPKHASKPQDSESSSDDLFEELLEGLTRVQELLNLPRKLQRKYGEQVGGTRSWNDWASVRGVVLAMLAAISTGAAQKVLENCRLDEPAWRMELKMFWDRYSLIDGEHPLFSSGIDTAAT